MSQCGRATKSIFIMVLCKLSSPKNMLHFFATCSTNIIFSAEPAQNFKYQFCHPNSIPWQTLKFVKSVTKTHGKNQFSKNLAQNPWQNLKIGNLGNRISGPKFPTKRAGPAGSALCFCYLLLSVLQISFFHSPCRLQYAYAAIGASPSTSAN